MEQVVVLHNETGLHARPAGIFVARASKFKSQIQIRASGETVNAKSIMNILGLGLEKGSEFAIIADGEDAEQAVKDLVSLVNKGFEE